MFNIILTYILKNRKTILYKVSNLINLSAFLVEVEVFFVIEGGAYIVYA